MPEATIHIGDCIDSMRKMPPDSVHSCVTDPPYGLSFMGRKWDYDVPSVETWKEVLRVLKPGGHLLAFGGSRTYHRMAVNVEDAGFEIRDCVMWLYGSGFPKSLDVSKAIDKAEGADREVIGRSPYAARRPNPMAGVAYGYNEHEYDISANLNITAPATDAAKQWDGWGTALKPAHEPIILARKPFPSTVAENVQEHGTGALNIDACRIEHDEECRMMQPQEHGLHNEKIRQAGRYEAKLELKPDGRWPANVVHDGSDEVVGRFPETESGELKPYKENHERPSSYSLQREKTYSSLPNSGSASRFFYCAKAAPSERGEYNNHPTVKPLALMQWLVRLVTPREGIVLDPFMGSGSTGIAALGQGFTFIGCELKEEYGRIAERRIRDAAPLFNHVQIAA